MNFAFYQHRTNWHKHPWVSKFLCWMGRHDFEQGREYGQLYCFYCDQTKSSHITYS